MKRKLSWLFRALGWLMLATALALTIYNMQDEKRAQRSADRAVEELLMVIPADARTAIAGNDVAAISESEPETETDTVEVAEETVPDHELNPNMEMPTKMANGYACIGVLEIPALSLTLPVISDWDYPRLKEAPCRYSGSAYTDNLVIMAHNFASHFGRIRDLTPGDSVVFTDTDGNVFRYSVGATEILSPEDVDTVIYSGWDLTLFTCTVGGQYRVTVYCDDI